MVKRPEDPFPHICEGLCPWLKPEGCECVGTSSKQGSDKGKGDGHNHKRPSTKRSTKHRNEGSKVNEGASTSSRPEEEEVDSTKKQLAKIKQQLTALPNAMKFVAPIVTELKAARDKYMEHEAASEEGEYPDSEAEQEPLLKKSEVILRMIYWL